VLLLDTHVVHWYASEPTRLSLAAREAIDADGDLAVASISWFELAWLAQHGRIIIDVPLRAWLDQFRDIRTLQITHAVVATAVSLPASFPGDPMDRLIYATAIEEGIQLVTRDEPMRRHPYHRQVTIW
jgi:PIN domain nuclease of toxin-antitoxin system